jgi:phosphatidate phosphatase APP1
VIYIGGTMRRFLGVLVLGMTFSLGAIDQVLAAPGGSSVAPSAATAKTSYVLVTDVDDTIKVSHVVDGLNKVIRFLSDPVSFAGMSKLYASLISEAQLRSQQTNFVVLSGTPQLFESSLWDFLEIFRFPEPQRLITRPMLLNTEQYKTEAVTEILADPQNASATVVLVGDDTQSDFDAYKNALNATTFGPMTVARQTQIYIRRVTGQAGTLVKSVPDAVAFDSAADIAMSEFMQGRLSRAAVESVFKEIETEKDFQRLFVPEEYCPGARDPRFSTALKGVDVPVDLLNRYVRLEDHLRERCSSLNAWIAGILE